MSRPLVDPIPLYAWSMAWRRDAASDGSPRFATRPPSSRTTEDWLRDAGVSDVDTWLPEPDASRLANGDFELVTATS